MRHEAASAWSSDRLDEIEKITIRTHESAIRIIDKTGPLHNPADRDHCLQYMVAVPLIFGGLTAEDYEDNVAADPRIDALRAKMVCVEDTQFTPTTSTRTSARSPTRCRFLQGRHADARSRGRISDRPSPPAQGGHSAAGREVPDQPGAPLSRPSSSSAILELALEPKSSRRRRCTNSSICSSSRFTLHTEAVNGVKQYFFFCTLILAAYLRAEAQDAPSASRGSGNSSGQGRAPKARSASSSCASTKLPTTCSVNWPKACAGESCNKDEVRREGDRLLVDAVCNSVGRKSSRRPKL